MGINTCTAAMGLMSRFGGSFGTIDSIPPCSAREENPADLPVQILLKERDSIERESKTLEREINEHIEINVKLRAKITAIDDAIKKITVFDASAEPLNNLVIKNIKRPVGRPKKAKK